MQRSPLRLVLAGLALGIVTGLALLLVPVTSASTAAVKVPATTTGSSRVTVSGASLVELSHTMRGTTIASTTVWLSRVTILASVRVRVGADDWTTCVWQPFLTRLYPVGAFGYTCSSIEQPATNGEFVIDVRR